VVNESIIQQMHWLIGMTIGFPSWARKEKHLIIPQPFDSCSQRSPRHVEYQPSCQWLPSCAKSPSWSLTRLSTCFTHWGGGQALRVGMCPNSKPVKDYESFHNDQTGLDHCVAHGRGSTASQPAPDRRA